MAPVDVGVGGSIPFVAAFAEQFPEAAILVTGVEDPDARAHGANESLHLGEFEKVCVAEACQAAGGRATAAKISQTLNVGYGETRPDGQVTLEPIYCLGLCSCAPAAMVDGRLIGLIDDEEIEEIAAECRA